MLIKPLRRDEINYEITMKCYARQAKNTEKNNNNKITKHHQINEM